MTDTDQTNIYSYKGTDYAGDLHDYLKSKNIAVRTADLKDGYLVILTEEVAYNVPQYATWGSIAEHMGETE